MDVDEMKKMVEAMLDALTPARAQRLASGLAGPGEAKDQVSRIAGELLQWSQRNAERLQTVVRREIESQLRTVGVATRADVDALAGRVRTLERSAAGSRASGSTASKGTKKATTKRATTKRVTAKRAAPKRAAAKRGTASTRTGRVRSA